MEGLLGVALARVDELLLFAVERWLDVGDRLAEDILTGAAMEAAAVGAAHKPTTEAKAAATAASSSE